MNAEILLMLIIVWLLMSPRFSMKLYNHFLLTPSKSCGNEEDIEAFRQLGGQPVYFSNKQGSKLRGWYFHSDDTEITRPSLLFYSMGADGDIPKRAQMLSLLLKHKMPIFIYEYSGFGESEGNPALRQCIKDSQAAFEFVMSHFKKKPEDILLYGESFGGAISTLLMQRYNACAIVIKSSFSSLARIARDLCLPLRLYPTYLFPQLDTASLLKTIHAPVLVIHGHKDRKIHWKHACTLHQAELVNRTLLWLPESRHAFLPAEDALAFTTGIGLFIAQAQAHSAMTQAQIDYYDLDVLAQSNGLPESEVKENWQTAPILYRQQTAKLQTFAASFAMPIRKANSVWQWLPSMPSKSREPG